MQKAIDNIKFAIIGYGHIGQKHADLILHQNSAELVAIVDVREASIHINIPFFLSINALLASKIEFDIAIIATPNGLHTEHALIFLNAGKHVIIEKPVALKSDEVKLIYDTADQNNKKVFAVFQNRFSPTTNWLKNLIDKKSLGQIYMVQVNCFWNRGIQYYEADHWHGTKDLDGGTLFTQFSHFIDMLLWLFGTMQNIKSELFNFNHQHSTQFEDSGIINFSFNDQTKGSLHFSTAVFDKNFESSILIIAEKGTIKIAGQYMDHLVYHHTQENLLEKLSLEKQDNHQLFLADVIKRLKNKDKPQITNQEAINTIKTIENIYLAAKNN